MFSESILVPATQTPKPPTRHSQFQKTCVYTKNVKCQCRECRLLLLDSVAVSTLLCAALCTAEQTELRKCQPKLQSQPAVTDSQQNCKAAEEMGDVEEVERRMRSFSRNANQQGGSGLSHRREFLPLTVKTHEVFVFPLP